MTITASSALWFLPFVLPLCYWTALSDLRGMRIPNKTVMLLAAVFVVVGLIAVPFPEYFWRLLSLVVVLLAGILLNAAGLVGAGDAKFAAAAAPFVAGGDVKPLLALFAACLLAAVITHRTAKHIPALRNLAPEWESWEQGRNFPMGLALGPTLAIYLILGALYGS